MMKPTLRQQPIFTLPAVIAAMVGMQFCAIAADEKNPTPEPPLVHAVENTGAEFPRRSCRPKPNCQQSNS